MINNIVPENWLEETLKGLPEDGGYRELYEHLYLTRFSEDGWMSMGVMKDMCPGVADSLNRNGDIGPELTGLVEIEGTGVGKDNIIVRVMEPVVLIARRIAEQVYLDHDDNADDDEVWELLTGVPKSCSEFLSAIRCISENSEKL